ncbi:DUF190 domain-containing protein [Acinetobacter sp. S40]|uniref:DUF190 domain-containing protein n=1 Tax=Acinetobacter sp. S40 TaxID=2767434 RepID=UPI001909A57F|nr:DUF190 domain-containing protein [Acinetobacter sp. S40]MBJ9985100.1 DUF190 domain-containing protein [Acinetobacter sp. S40]
MQGYQITFYSQLSVTQEGIPIHRWLLDVAKKMNLRGATVVNGREGLDHRGKFHSAGFFEMVDQPVLIQFILTAQESEQLFAYLKEIELELFYVKLDVEFGVIGSGE